MQLTVDAAIERSSFGRAQAYYIISASTVFFLELMNLVTDGILLPTIKCEFNLQSREATVYLLLTRLAFFAGGLLGGRFGDSMGRRKSIMLGLILQIVITNASIRATDAITYTILHALCKIAFGIVMPSTYSLTVEVCPANRRYLVKMIFGIAGTTGAFFGASLSRHYSQNTWRTALGALSALCFLPAMSTFVLDESPRFLTVQDRLAEAEAVVARIWQRNGITVPPKFELKPEPPVEACGSFRELFKYGLARLSARLMYVMAMKGVFITTLYISLQYIFGRDSHSHEPCHTMSSKTFSQMALAFIPDYLVMPSALVLAQRWGRKSSISTCFLISAVFLGASSLLPPSPLFSVIFGVGVSGTAAARSVIVLYTSELYPTSLRSVANGLIWSSDTLGSTVAPFLAEYVVVHHARPFLLVAAVAIATCVFVIRRIERETLNQPLLSSVRSFNPTTESVKA